MVGFADSFWAPAGTYSSSLTTLFDKLDQGVKENEQVLVVARLRADAEEAYSSKLLEISPASDRPDGFAKDEGASLKKAFDGMREEMQEAGKASQKMARNLRELVVQPFSKWAEGHEYRVNQSREELFRRLRSHDRQAEVVKKLRTTYYNKCRQLEDFEEENKFAFQEPEEKKDKGKEPMVVPEVRITPDEPEEEEIIDIGDLSYSMDQVKKILTHMLEHIKIGEVKVPILGTYQNVSTGADIVEYLQQHLNATTVSTAERIGQDLVTNGFLRLVGSVGSTFANSSKMNYQWRPAVYKLTGVPEKKDIKRTGTLGDAIADSPTISTVTGIMSQWGAFGNTFQNETPGEKLKRETSDADKKYKESVETLDSIRCDLEACMFDHLRFLERCEQDRLRAVKTVVLDFSGAISNVMPTIQSTVDKMMLFQESIQPEGDLRYMLENYRTGGFAPKVPVYENYYAAIENQTYGIDLEARAKADKKRVPLIVSRIFTYLDGRYPELEGNEARRAIWVVDVSLRKTHQLRLLINTNNEITNEMLEQFDIPIVANALKLYLLELPESLVPPGSYDIVKAIYATHGGEDDLETRVSVIQHTLGQLKLPMIATLDSLTTHFTRLIELTSADEEYVARLAQVLAPCILRPKTQSVVTMEDRHPYRLVRDLFAQKEAIFGELKRSNSAARHSQAPTGRPRVGSTDESARRAAFEARINAKQAPRSRGTSPAPGPRGHRREGSTNHAETRFPIATSGLPPRSPRQSLEVPDKVAAAVNSSAGSITTSDTVSSPPADPASEGFDLPSQRNVTTTTGELHRFGSGGRRHQLSDNPVSHDGNGTPISPQVHRASTGEEGRPGVTLEDKPMY